MKKDKAYLKHILDAFSDIEKFTEGIIKERFFENKEKQYAVLRGLEIIGEATKNLSRELKAKYCQVPWKDIAGMRDKLIHFYFGIDYKLVWETIKKRIPEVKPVIKEILEKYERISRVKRQKEKPQLKTKMKNKKIIKQFPEKNGVNRVRPHFILV